MAYASEFLAYASWGILASIGNKVVRTLAFVPHQLSTLRATQHLSGRWNNVPALTFKGVGHSIISGAIESTPAAT